MTARMWEMVAMGAAPPSALASVAVVAQAAADLPLPAWLQLALGPLGLLVMFIVIGIAGAKREPSWVFGHHYRAMETKYQADLAELRREIADWKALSAKTTDLGFELLRENSRVRTSRGEER